MNAARALVDTLLAHGVDRAFCVPGESFLAVLDAMHDRPQLQMITCRHEGGAGLMASADARITGRPGVAFVSRGPGATNASIALHVAQQDGIPLVLFVGQVERKDRGRGAFQEVDYRDAFGGLCKGVWEVQRGADLSPICAQAFRIAVEGVPGPVLIALPEDMLLDEDCKPAAAQLRAVEHRSDVGDLREVAASLSRSRRPLVIVGSALEPKDVSALVAVSERFALPVVTEWKYQHLFPNRHPHYAGHLGYNIPARKLKMLEPSDLVLALGTRLGDVTTQGYRFPRGPIPEQPLIHVHPAADGIGRVYEPTLTLQADLGAFLRQLLEEVSEVPHERASWLEGLREEVQAEMRWSPVEAEDGVVFGQVMNTLDRLLPEDAILTQDAGNFSGWLHRYFHCSGRHLLLGCQAGAMGFGVPAAVAAALREPSRRVVGFVGDGGVLMTGNEIATALQYGAAPLIVLSDNGSYGTIRQHQEGQYPGRVQSTNLRNPDFVAWARSFGAEAMCIDRSEDVEPMLRQALANAVLTVVVVRTSLRHISAWRTLPSGQY